MSIIQKLRDWRREHIEELNNADIESSVKDTIYPGHCDNKLSLGFKKNNVLLSFTSWNRADLGKIFTEIIVFNQASDETILVLDQEWSADIKVIKCLTETIKKLVEGG